MRYYHSPSFLQDCKQGQFVPLFVTTTITVLDIHQRALPNSETGIFLYPDFFSETRENSPEFFSASETGYMYLRLLHTAEYLCKHRITVRYWERSPARGIGWDRFVLCRRFYFLKCSTRIISWDQNAFFLLALSLNKVTKYPNHPKIQKAFLAELLNDVPELSDLDSLQCLPLAPKSYACIIRAFLCVNEISEFWYKDNIEQE